MYCNVFVSLHKTAGLITCLSERYSDSSLADWVHTLPRSMSEFVFGRLFESRYMCTCIVKKNAQMPQLLGKSWGKSLQSMESSIVTNWDLQCICFLNTFKLAERLKNKIYKFVFMQTRSLVISHC